MRFFKIKQSYKTLHNNPAISLGECTASLNKEGKIQINGFKELNNSDKFIVDFVFPNMKRAARSAIKSFINDPKYCYIWDENNGIESFVKEI